MFRVRLILAWLLMAAVPLQGWAAATMLFCGPAQSAVHAHDRAAGADARHHDSHAGDHHAMHAHHDMGSHAQPAGGEPDTCSVCAACSHGVALAQTPQWPPVSDAPRADPAEPLVAILAQPSPVPDKPPRA